MDGPFSGLIKGIWIHQGKFSYLAVQHFTCHVYISHKMHSEVSSWDSISNFKDQFVQSQSLDRYLKSLWMDMKGLPPHLLEPFVTPPTKMSCWGTACRRMPRKFWRFLPEAASQALKLVPHFLVQQKHRLIQTKNVWTNLKPPGGRWKHETTPICQCAGEALGFRGSRWWRWRNAEVGNRRVEGRVKKVMSP